MSAGDAKAAYYRRVILRDVAGALHGGPLELLYHNATPQPDAGSALGTACAVGAAHTT